MPRPSVVALASTVAAALALGSVLLVPARAEAQPLTGELLPHPPTVDKLDNGLTVVTVPFASPGTVSFYTLVRAGSRDEVEPGKSGYAHLFEHLMFRGTEKMSAADYERRLQAMGADNNAYTTDDFTLYTPTVPKEALPELVAVEAERFMHLAYAKSAYKDETGAVLGEYNKDFANPYWVMDEALRATAFKVHTYGHTTLGYKRDVEAMPAAYDYSRSFFKRFYTPDDCTIVVTGDFDRAKVLDLIRANYKDWQGKRASTDAKKEPDQTAPRTKALTWKSPTVPRLMVGWRIPATSASVKRAAAYVVLTALVFGESSDLYQRLVVRDQKVIELESDPDLLSRDPGLFRYDAKLKPSTSFDEIVKAVDDELAKVAAGETPAARIDAVKRHTLHATLIGLDTPMSLAERLAYWTAVTGDVHAFEGYGRALATLTPQDVADAAKELVPAHRNVVTLSPPGGAVAAAAATAGGAK